MTYWTLTYDPSGANLEQSLAAWGIANMDIQTQSAAMDACTFLTPQVPLDGSQTFAFRKQVIIRSGRTSATGAANSFGGGQIWFQGLVTKSPQTGSGSREDRSYTVSGPWWYFEKRTMQRQYQQIQSVASDGTPTYATQSTPHFLLNRTIYGYLLCTGEEIQNAVNWAILNGAPVQLGPVVQQPVPAMNIPYGNNSGFVSVSSTIQSFVYVASDEVNTITVAEAIRKELRWTPDAVAWFDYTTIPPTFNVRRATGAIAGLDGGGSTPLTPVSLSSLNGGGGNDLTGATNPYSVSKANFSARNDLLVPYVLIWFEVTNQFNGQSYYFRYSTQWPAVLPTGAASFGGLEATVSLAGINLNTQTAQMETQPLPDFTNYGAVKSWLVGRGQWLNDPTVASVVVTAVTNPDGTAYTPSYPYVITRGSFAPWMQLQNQSGAGTSPVGKAKRDVLLVQYNRVMANGEVKQGEQMQVEVTTCNLNTKGQLLTFTTQSGNPFPEYPPPNLAQDMYNALNVLQWEGELEATQTEADLGVGIGNALNISDNPNWSAMNATVYSVNVDVDSGKTTIKTGPNKLLTAGELVDLMRVVRYRLVLMPPTALGNGDVSGGSAAELADHFPSGQAAAGAGYNNTVVSSDTPQGDRNVAALAAIQGPQNPSGGPALVLGTPGNPAIVALNAVDCVVNGVVRQLRVMAVQVCAVDASGNPIPGQYKQQLFLCSLPF